MACEEHGVTSGKCKACRASYMRRWNADAKNHARVSDGRKRNRDARIALGLTSKGEERKPVRVAPVGEAKRIYQCENTARYRERHPEKRHLWRKSNRERNNASERMARARKKNHPEVIAAKRKRFAATRLRAILKLGGLCITCGFRDVRALEFDHRDPLLNTKGRRSSIYEILSMENPASVFDLLCANCHTIKTKEGLEHWAWRHKRKPTQGILFD